jgi:hypothetical protein
MWESIAKTLAKKDGPQAAINFMRSKLARIGIISTAEVASGMGVAKFAEYTNDALKDVESTAKALEGVAMDSPQKIIEAAKSIDKIGYVEEQEARNIIESYTHYKSGNQKSPATRWAGWFQSVNAANKKFIVDDIQNDPKLRNAMLSLFYDVYKAEFNFNGTFDDFLNAEITLYRGITLADKKGVGQEGFSAFSTTKNRVMPYADEQALGKGKIREIKIKPKDTYGAVNYIGGGEVEVLVPTDFKKETLKDDFNRLVELNIGLFNEEQLNYIEKLYDKEDYISGIAFAKSVISSNPKKISEAYHKAKADGSNPELVKAVEQSIKETPQSGGGVKLSSSNTLQKSVSMVLNAPIEYMKMIINSEVAAERKETDKTKKSQLRKSIQENKKVLAHLIAARKDPKFSKDAEVYRGVAIALANGQHIVAALESPVPTTFAHEAIFHSTIEPFLETDLEAKQAFIDEYNEVFEANESEWSTDVSEYTARVYEKYLSNGRKLTEADVKDKGRRATLQKAFDAFTEMMKNLYQSVISYKGKEIQLSDQARMFFDKVHGLNTQSVAETIVESSMSPVHKNIFDLMTNKKSSADITSEEVFDIFRYAKNAGIYLGENNKLTKKCN